MQKLILVLIMIAVLITACGKQEIDCLRIEDDILIDGFDDEWSEIPFTYFEDEKISVKICHNDEYVYLLAKFTNNQTAMRIYNFGITFWINLDGRRSKLDGYKFIGETADEHYPVMDAGGFGEMHGLKQNGSGLNQPHMPGLGKLNPELLLEGQPARHYPMVEIEGSAGAFSDSHGLKTYEFRIPVITEKVGQTINLLKAEKLCAGIEIGKMDIDMMRPNIGSRGVGGGGMSPGGGKGRGMVGGKRPGGGIGGRPGGTPNLPKLEIWAMVHFI